MKVGIAGAGSIAIGYAALLLQNGHEPLIWSRSRERTTDFSAGAPVKITGAISMEFHPHICTNAEELAEADVIVLALPAYGHRFVLDALLPHLSARHSVIISAHLSFAALYLAKGLAERGIEIPITAWSTTVLTCKPRAADTFNIGAIRAKVDMATLPARFAGRAHETCVGLFGDRFDVKDDILTIALSNLNPQDHIGIALCNLSRIERAEDWGQNTNVTPAVGRFLEALDLEGWQSRPLSARRSDPPSITSDYRSTYPANRFQKYHRSWSSAEATRQVRRASILATCSKTFPLV